jgi:hypothetical protein
MKLITQLRSLSLQLLARQVEAPSEERKWVSNWHKAKSGARLDAASVIFLSDDILTATAAPAQTQKPSSHPQTTAAIAVRWSRKPPRCLSHKLGAISGRLVLPVQRCRFWEHRLRDEGDAPRIVTTFTTIQLIINVVCCLLLGLFQGCIDSSLKEFIRPIWVNVLLI